MAIPGYGIGYCDCAAECPPRSPFVVRNDKAPFLYPSRNGHLQGERHCVLYPVPVGGEV